MSRCNTFIVISRPFVLAVWAVPESLIAVLHSHNIGKMSVIAIKVFPLLRDLKPLEVNAASWAMGRDH